MSNNGLRDLSKKLDGIAKNVKALADTKSASLTDVLTPQFISEHTRFQNADQFFEASGFKIESQADFEAIPEDKFDIFVSSISSFSSWREMLNTAGTTWAKNKLGF